MTDLTETRERITHSFNISAQDAATLLTGTDEATLTAQAQRLTEIDANNDLMSRVQGNVAPREGATTQCYTSQGVRDLDMKEFTRELFGADE